MQDLKVAMATGSGLKVGKRHVSDTERLFHTLELICYSGYKNALIDLMLLFMTMVYLAYSLFHQV